MTAFSNALNTSQARTLAPSCGDERYGPVRLGLAPRPTHEGGRPMENAHLRLGMLEYQRITEAHSTRIRVRVDRYVGEDRRAHLISVFGSDSDIGAVTAAVHEKATFTVTLPDGSVKEVTLGEHASCYKGSISLPDRKQPVRHLVAVSAELHANGTSGRTMLLRYERDDAWATLVSSMGLPGDPSWAEYVCAELERQERVQDLDGIGCRPVQLLVTEDEVLEWVGVGLRTGALRFPEINGPILWQPRSLTDLLSAESRGASSALEEDAAA